MPSFKYPKPLPEPLRQSALSLVAPALCVRYVEGLRACRKAGLRVIPFESLRTSGRQQWLYQQGRDWAGTIVTQAPTLETSWHGGGCALDTAFVKDDGSIYWPTSAATWLHYGQIMESVGLAWGGRWKRPDSPHVQLQYVPKTPTLEDGKYILSGRLQDLWHKYDADRISYYDDVSKI